MCVPNVSPSNRTFHPLDFSYLGTWRLCLPPFPPFSSLNFHEFFFYFRSLCSGPSRHECFCSYLAPFWGNGIHGQVWELGASNTAEESLATRSNQKLRSRTHRNKSATKLSPLTRLYILWFSRGAGRRLAGWAVLRILVITLSPGDEPCRQPNLSTSPLLSSPLGKIKPGTLKRERGAAPRTDSFSSQRNKEWTRPVLQVPA